MNAIFAAGLIVTGADRMPAISMTSNARGWEVVAVQEAAALFAICKHVGRFMTELASV